MHRVWTFLDRIHVAQTKTNRNITAELGGFIHLECSDAAVRWQRRLRWNGICKQQTSTIIIWYKMYYMRLCVCRPIWSAMHHQRQQNAVCTWSNAGRHIPIFRKHWNGYLSWCYRRSVPLADVTPLPGVVLDATQTIQKDDLFCAAHSHLDGPSDVIA